MTKAEGFNNVPLSMANYSETELKLLKSNPVYHFYRLHLKRRTKRFLDRLTVERPVLGFRSNLVSENRDIEAFEIKAKELVKNGILFLPGYFKGEVLGKMQSEFNEQIKSEKYQINEEATFVPDAHIVHCPALSASALDREMTALTEYYYGKEILLANTGGYRIPPIEPRDFGSFQWHHDEKGKVIKAMILLTDVGPSDQRMDYIVGTNKRLNPWVIYQDSRFTNEQANKMGKIAPCIGSAGTVILFDTNGIHRGNRNNSKVRDVWVHNYTSGNALYPSNPLHPGALKNLSNREKKILRLPE